MGMRKTGSDTEPTASVRACVDENDCDTTDICAQRTQSCSRIVYDAVRAANLRSFDSIIARLATGSMRPTHNFLCTTCVFASPFIWMTTFAIDPWTPFWFSSSTASCFERCAHSQTKHLSELKIKLWFRTDKMKSGRSFRRFIAVYEYAFARRHSRNVPGFRARFGRFS